MKYIHGFLSKRLKEVGVSHDESLVIRYLLNFINSNRMEKILVEGEFYDLGVKPLDWDERLNLMSASTRKKREKAKFLGIFKRYTKKDAEGTRSYFAPTDILYSLLPDITEDDNDMKNKKASTDGESAKATKQNKNIIDTNSIPRNNKKYSWKNMENKNKTGKGASANVNNTFDQYEEKELEEMLREKQKDKFDNVQEFKPSFRI